MNIQECVVKVVLATKRYYSVLNRFVSDELVLRQSLQDLKYQGKEPTLHPDSIEKRSKLAPLPKESVKESDFTRMLGDFSNLSLAVEGNTFSKQISSLLPSFDSDAMTYETGVHYFLSRLMLGRLPRNHKWLLYQQDIDHITSALFIVNEISSKIGVRLNWLEILHGPNAGQYPSRVPQLVSRPDSVMIKDQPEFLTKSKHEIGIGGYEPLRKICMELNRSKSFQSISYQDVTKATGFSPSKARYVASLLDLVLTEHAILIPKMLDLQHRWIITEKARKYKTSPGLIHRFDCRPYDEMIEERRRYKWGDIDRHHIIIPTEFKEALSNPHISDEDLEKAYRILLRQKGLSSLDRIIESKIDLQQSENRTREETNELAELRSLEVKFKTIITREMQDEFPTFANIEGATIHLEPRDSGGPKNLELGASDFITEEELISYRLDLYDTEKRLWNFRPWERSSPSEEKYWTYFDTSSIKGKSINLTPDDVLLMAHLLLNRGSPGNRNLILSMIEMDSRLIAQIVDRVTKASAMIPLYYPSLEYSGLSEGALILIPSIDKRALNRVKKWLIEISPFIHLYWSKEGSLAAKIYAPSGRGGLLLAVLNNEILEKWTDYEIHLGSIKQEISYMFTMPSKLFDSEKTRWRNPWMS
ncbi:MAG: hypothetical protein ACFFED_15645 [Candidatus Thorarchaeota archaeon]